MLADVVERLLEGEKHMTPEQQAEAAVAEIRRFDHHETSLSPRIACADCRIWSPDRAAEMAAVDQPDDVVHRCRGLVGRLLDRRKSSAPGDPGCVCCPFRSAARCPRGCCRCRRAGRARSGRAVVPPPAPGWCAAAPASIPSRSGPSIRCRRRHNHDPNPSSGPCARSMRASNDSRSRSSPPRRPIRSRNSGNSTNLWRLLKPSVATGRNAAGTVPGSRRSPSPLCRAPRSHRRSRPGFPQGRSCTSQSVPHSALVTSRRKRPGFPETGITTAQSPG
jgi:hypothetical protein